LNAQTPGAVLEFLPANTECDGILTCGGANFQQSCLKVEFPFVDGPWTTVPERIQAALQLDKGTNVLVVVNVERKHVPFIEVPIPVRILSLVIVSDLLPDFSGLTTNGHEPIVIPMAKPDVFDGVPEVLPQAGSREKLQFSSSLSNM
jgi:hypothetical protein